MRRRFYGATVLPVSPIGNLVLIGFMGSGKSSLGRLLAERLGHQFLDTDQLVIEAAGCEITEIFASAGEAHFRDLETKALTGLAGRTPLVIATGGGILLRPENTALLRQLGFVIWLTASEDVIFERVSRNRRRPLLHTDDPRATVRELIATRTPLYAAAAQYTLDSSTLSRSSAVQRVLHAAHHHFGAQAAS